MSVRAKVNYKETYRGIDIECKFTEDLDTIQSGFLNEISARLHVLIDNHQEKTRRRRLRGQPYVGASALAISNIRTLFGEPVMVFRRFGKPRQRKTPEALLCEETTCPRCGWQGCYYCAQGFCPKCGKSLPKPQEQMKNEANTSDKRNWKARSVDPWQKGVLDYS